MPRQLIVNADDYGLTRGVSRGIREAHEHGIVTSTTVMMNIPGAADDLRLALDETPQLGLGVHLVLTAGNPILPPHEVPDLVSAERGFRPLAEFTAIRQDIHPEQARAEWTAQIDAFVAVAGSPPDHLDSHHHTSFFSEGLFRAFLDLASEYGCAVRCPLNTLDGSGLPEQVSDDFASFAPAILKEHRPRTSGAFCADFYAEGATRQSLASILDRLPTGTLELMCHPGHADDQLSSVSSYTVTREVELTLLGRPAARAAIASRRIQLIKFGDLEQESSG
jgi:predicted glycoside hydrolase/deacetylase ChbG (UPF0249 family)